MTITERLSAALAGRYRIERELGAGGMATVYLAEDVKHDRKVALKVLKPELAAVLGAERFVVEIKTTASLQHPHILPLFDSGTADGFLFYVMPFIDGETLRDKLNRETQLGVDEAVKIATEVADALHYAHTHGVIHRDIKPENILLANGRPVVADFGIALAVSAAAGGRMTETGLSLGTPHYMSPEQATAEKELTARSDVYSLGSVLYEMLAGQPPHLGGSAQQIIMKIITEPAPAVTAHRKSVPPNVAAAVAKSLEKLPADRFDTAKAFADALVNPAFGATTMAVAGGMRRAAPSRAMLVGGVLLGAIAGAAAVALLSGGDVRVGERNREQVTFHGQAQRPAISPDGDFVAYVEGDCARGGFAWCKSSLVIQEVGSTQPRVLVRDAPFLGQPRWSHDGQTVVIRGQLDKDRGGLFAISRRDGTARPIADNPIDAYDTHPSGDSVLVMRSSESGARALVIAMASGAVIDSMNMPFADPLDVSWSPDGRFIAATELSIVWIADRAGPLVDSLTVGGARGPLRWGVDGRDLLMFRTGAAREDPFVRVHVSSAGSMAREAEVLLNRVPTLYRGSFDIARRTGRLVIGTGDAITDVWSFDFSGSTTRAHRETHGTSWYGRPDLSSDGKRIFYFRGDALGDNVYQRDRATGAEEALTAERTPGANEVRLSSDDRRLVFGRVSDNGLLLQHMELPSRRVSGSVLVADGDVLPMAPTGFLSVDNGRLSRVDSLGGKWVSIPISEIERLGRYAASPDGSTIAIIALQKPATVVVGTVPRAGGPLRVVATLPPEDVSPSLLWDREGELILARWRNEDEHPSAWRLTIADRALSRIADLPAPCEPVSMKIRAAARAAVCLVRDYRSDVWLFDIAGVTR